MNIIKEKIEQVLRAEEDGRQMIDSGYENADKIVSEARKKVREIEINLMTRAEEISAQAKSGMDEETSRMIRKIEHQTGEEIRSIQEWGRKNISSTVYFILKRILEI